MHPFETPFRKAADARSVEKKEDLMAAIAEQLTLTEEPGGYMKSPDTTIVPLSESHFGLQVR